MIVGSVQAGFLSSNSCYKNWKSDS